MSAPTCIITGIALVYDGRWVAGDLFDAGDCFVFNGNFEVSGNSVQPAWQHGEPFYAKRIEPRDFWERRGVFVINIRDAELNEAARLYLAGIA